MYKLVLADDERVIREGVARSVNWGSLDILLIGTAENGLEAYEMILEHAPQIVITDIKMPGMDGLELISKIKAINPAVHFIVLSGHSEFEFAREAMQYGVQHYLLKPCKEKKIEGIVLEVVGEIRQTESRNRFIEDMTGKLEVILPQAREQFLRDFTVNGRHTREEWNRYRELFAIQDGRCQILLFQLDGSRDYKELFSLKNLCEEAMSRDAVMHLCTIVGEQVLVMIEDTDETTLFAVIQQIKQNMQQYCGLDITIAVSDPGPLLRSPFLYRETLECLKHRFYLGEGSIITQKDVAAGGKGREKKDFVFPYDRMALAVRSGNAGDAAMLMKHFFDELNGTKYDIHTAKTHIMELFTIIIRQSGRIDEYMKKILWIEELETLDQFNEHMSALAEEITREIYENHAQRHNALIAKVVEYVQDNIADEELSLNWIANKILYVNVDYLGKLFKKETKEKFSRYVMRLRIEAAKSLIESMEYDKIVDVACRVGLGSNTQYFSKLFKEYTGCMPTEYRKRFQ